MEPRKLRRSAPNAAAGLRAFGMQKRAISRLRSAHYLRLLVPALLGAVILLFGHAGSAQEMRREPVPFTVWLDFRALARVNPPRLALPVWLESITSEHPKRQPGQPETTI